jgi:methionyl-tRNA formyltransferase
MFRRPALLWSPAKHELGRKVYMRVVFIGASSFGLKCLNAIYRVPGVSIVGVITNPKEFSISYSDKQITNVLHADFMVWCSQHSIPCHEMARSMRDDALIAWIRALEPQLFIVVGWYHMVPKVMRDIAPAFGLHASLLPDYSGGAPLVWAMINGESKTGITFFQMDDGVDSGYIVGQAQELILPSDTIASLYARIEKRGVELLKRYLPALILGTVELRPQDESARRIFPQRSPDDGWIDWNQDAKVIDRFIRAQTRPYPGAFTSLADGRILTIWSALPISDNHNCVPATVIRVGNFFQVQCKEGSLLLQETSCEGQAYDAVELESLLCGTTKLGATRLPKPEIIMGEGKC